ncbi:MAG: hypothetical protein AB1817_01620 [Chloroflexota bacterium]
MKRIFALAVFVGLLFALFSLAQTQSRAQAATPQSLISNLQSPTSNLQSPIGNYCLECHVNTPAHPLDALRPVEWARDIPCATLRKAYEGVWQTDTLVAAFQNAQNDVRTVGIDTSAQAKRINAQRVIAERFPRDNDVSLAAMTNRYQTARFQMNKAYAAMNDARAERDRVFILIAVALATIFVVVGIFLGWRNTFRGKGKAVHPRAAWALAAVGMIVVFILFANPLFAFAPPLPTPTEEETARQTAVDQATRVSDAVARFSAQSWVLGRIGAQWNATDKPQANAAYADALTSARDKNANLAAYWGQLQAVRENAVTWNAATQDLAVFRADKIESAAQQSWQYRAIATEWLTVDKAKAADALQLALASISNLQSPISNLQRDFELRALAVTWHKLDAAKANELIAQVQDPFLRAWGLREMAQYDKALQAAREVKSHYDRAWALREIARASGNVALLNDALDAANKIENAETRAYALADIAIVWSAKDNAKGQEIIAKIPDAYPAARVMALRGAGNATTDANRAKEFFTRALADAKKVDGAYTMEKLAAAIAADLARVDAAGALDVASKLNDAVLRDQAYRDIAIALNASDVAAKIATPTFRVQALTALGAKASDKTQAAKYFQDAFALADKMEDLAALRDLAIAWSALDTKAALAVVDKLEDASDKVAALQAIALELAKTDKQQSAQVFDRAVNLAKSVRVRGESFASARALAALASSYAAIDAARANQAFVAALEAAKRVNVKY